MSTSSPCSETLASCGGSAARRLLAPLTGAVLAVALFAAANGGLSLMAAENTHLPAERLAEIEAMMRAD